LTCADDTAMSVTDKMDGPGGTTRGWLAKLGDDK
jgi:hypothetical protein